MSTQSKKQGKAPLVPYRNLEDEDAIQEIAIDENLDDFFIRLFHQSSVKPESNIKTNQLTCNIGMLDIEVSDAFLSRVMDHIVTDFPQNLAHEQHEQLIAQPIVEAEQLTKLNLDGLNLILSVKQDVT